MHKKLTESEEKRANEIKSSFSEVHNQISQIQEEMNSLAKKADFLVQKLELLRGEELKFVQILEQKYGQGSLDPFNMIYKTKKENEICS